MKTLYRGKPIKYTDDPYELAGEMMEIDGQEEGNDMLVSLYFDKAERLIREWKSERI